MVEAYKTILSESASVRRAEDLARRLKAQYDQKPTQRVERIHSDELDAMAKDIAQAVNGMVKITQSKVEARVIFVIRGNLETTSKNPQNASRQTCSGQKIINQCFPYTLSCCV